MTFANDFLISSLFLSARWKFFSLLSRGGGLLVSPKLALGEFLQLAAEGLNCFEDCVPETEPVLVLLCAMPKLSAKCVAEYFWGRLSHPFWQMAFWNLLFYDLGQYVV
jgi:hypothetical protein